jgi:hypothetical protein
MHGAAGDYTPVGGIWSRHYNWLILKDSCREKDAFFHGRHDHRAVFLQRLQLWLGMLASERGVATHRTSCSCASGFSASVCLDEAGARLIYSLHAGRSCCNSGPAVSLHMQAIGWIRRYATRGRVACEHGFCLFPFACKESVDEEAMRRCWCVGRSREMLDVASLLPHASFWFVFLCMDTWYCQSSQRSEIFVEHGWVAGVDHADNHVLLGRCTYIYSRPDNRPTSVCYGLWLRDCLFGLVLFKTQLFGWWLLGPVFMVAAGIKAKAVCLSYFLCAVHWLLRWNKCVISEMTLIM